MKFSSGFLILSSKSKPVLPVNAPEVAAYMIHRKINIKRVCGLATIIVSLLLHFSCSNSGTSEKRKQQERKKSEAAWTVYKKPPSSFNDTLIIMGNSAVFYNSDLLQLEKIKAITEKMVYESNIHDCFYQMRNARVVLKKYWPQIQITETSKARYLLFIKEDKSKIYIDLNTQNDQCGIFLFDPQKKPQLVDMTNIDSELGFYFSE